MAAAINEGKRHADIQKRKEESERLREEAAAKAEAARIAAENERRIAAEAAELEKQEAEKIAEQVVQDFSTVRQWIAFKANLTIDQARELRTFFESRGIQYQAI
jgi:transposase